MMSSELYGQEIGGYTIERRIDVGGMGEVYAASKDGIEYAFKIMLEALAAQSEQRERFLREVELMRALRHPNIMPLLDYGLYRDRLYLVMPLVEGMTLQALIDAMRFTPKLAWIILDPLTQGLAHAHMQGIVHRDLKPGNVLIAREDDHVYLSDFGLSKRPDFDSGLTATGTMIGTPAYMSPEASLAEEVDLRGDIYSLGIILYEMLFNRLPYAGLKDTALIAAHLYQPAPLPADLPPALQGVFERALAKNRQNRYPSLRPFIVDYVDALDALGADAEREYTL